MSKGKHKHAADRRRALAESEAVAELRQGFDAERRQWTEERNALRRELAETRGRFENDVAAHAAERITAAYADFDAQLEERTTGLREALRVVLEINDRHGCTMTATELTRLHELTGETYEALWPEDGGCRDDRRARAKHFRALDNVEAAELAKPAHKRADWFNDLAPDAPRTPVLRGRRRASPSTRQRPGATTPGTVHDRSPAISSTPEGTAGVGQSGGPETGGNER